MTTMRSIACTACGADVPQGRLSCPSCGELLASVSGSMRSTWVATTEEERPMLDALLEDEPLASATAGDSPTAVAEPPLVLGLVDEADPAPDPDPEPDLPDAPEADPISMLDPEPESLLEPEPEPEPLLEPEPELAPRAVEPPAPSWPAPRSEAPSWPEPPPVVPLASPPPPGSYLPPTAPPVLGTAAAATATVPAGPAAPARAWAGPSATDTPTVDPATAEEARDERARVDEMIGWVAVAGCALALLGFLIPWARTMIGSGGTGYLDQWGLAGSGHVVIVLAIGAILIATVAAPDRIPARYRLGIPGLIVGAILIGLVWPYVLGPLGALPGAFLSLAGAFTLVGAAVATLVVDRHAGRGSGV